MSFMISMECINCGACEAECPTRAIAPGASQYAIDAKTCVECDGYFEVQRCKAVCPVNACRPRDENYVLRMTSLSARGISPVVLRPVIFPRT
jgi:ferredoxin